MDGIIILDKDEGVFSRTAGRRIANIFKEKKFGHIGTLDPMASGLLPIAIGNATKMIPFIEDFCPNKKEYLFGLKFGFETDSLDITGKTVNTSDIIPDETSVKKACLSLTGEQKQIPPQFSAIHVNGKRAYELVRQGKKVQMQPRDVVIYKLEYINKTDDIYNFRVICNRGTYVRSIVRDIGYLCKTFATTIYIRRTYTNGFDIKNAIKLDFLENLVNNTGAVEKYLMASDCALGDIPVINLGNEDTEKYKNGGFIKVNENDGFYRVYADKTFIGIGKIENCLLRPKRTI